jgi:surfeit locus 1 family protein
MKRMGHFKHWIAVGILLLAVTGFVRLGRWQLDRADFNRSLTAGFVRSAELPEIDLLNAARDADSLRYRRIRLRGRYAAAKQILLDNMTYQGQAGYQVLTPLRVAGERLVLVNRGWVPAAPDRSQLPDVGLADEAIEVSGRIDRLPRAALALSSPPAGEGSLAVLSYPDFAGIESVLGQDDYPFVILLDADAPAGFVRDWAPAGDRADRNIAYAVQWFGLALLALILAVGIVVRDLRRRREVTA